MYLIYKNKHLSWLLKIIKRTWLPACQQHFHNIRGTFKILIMPKGALEIKKIINKRPSCYRTALNIISVHLNIHLY